MTQPDHTQQFPYSHESVSGSSRPYQMDERGYLKRDFKFPPPAEDAPPPLAMQPATHHQHDEEVGDAQQGLAYLRGVDDSEPNVTAAQNVKDWLDNQDLPVFDPVTSTFFTADMHDMTGVTGAGSYSPEVTSFETIDRNGHAAVNPVETASYYGTGSYSPAAPNSQVTDRNGHAVVNPAGTASYYNTAMPNVQSGIGYQLQADDLSSSPYSVRPLFSSFPSTSQPAPTPPSPEPEAESPLVVMDPLFCCPPPVRVCSFQQSHTHKEKLLWTFCFYQHQKDVLLVPPHLDLANVTSRAAVIRLETWINRDKVLQRYFIQIPKDEIPIADPTQWCHVELPERDVLDNGWEISPVYIKVSMDMQSCTHPDTFYVVRMMEKGEPEEEKSEREEREMIASFVDKEDGSLWWGGSGLGWGFGKMQNDKYAQKDITFFAPAPGGRKWKQVNERDDGYEGEEQKVDQPVDTVMSEPGVIPRADIPAREWFTQEEYNEHVVHLMGMEDDESLEGSSPEATERDTQPIMENSYGMTQQTELRPLPFHILQSIPPLRINKTKALQDRVDLVAYDRHLMATKFAEGRRARHERIKRMQGMRPAEEDEDEDYDDDDGDDNITVMQESPAQPAPVPATFTTPEEYDESMQWQNQNSISPDEWMNEFNYSPSRSAQSHAPTQPLQLARPIQPAPLAVVTPTPAPLALKTKPEPKTEAEWYDYAVKEWGQHLADSPSFMEGLMSTVPKLNVQRSGGAIALRGAEAHDQDDDDDDFWRS